jgi:hypothetical protein
MFEYVKISDLPEAVEYQSQRFFVGLPSGEIAVKSFQEWDGDESVLFIDGDVTKTVLAADLTSKISGDPYGAVLELAGPTFTLPAYPDDTFQKISDLEVNNQLSDDSFFPLAGAGAVLGVGPDRVFALLATAKKIKYTNLTASLAPIVQQGVGFWSIGGTFRVS